MVHQVLRVISFVKSLIDTSFGVEAVFDEGLALVLSRHTISMTPEPDQDIPMPRIPTPRFSDFKSNGTMG